ncbi:hypothetical protein QBC34DRAFT_164257 [Podospora aff. communis PSN243]|uniref:BTB domain-containing protein n=1 Tax=Podospora aff. communis PSN243 TaxID=3040156 RepID=A0AAV9GC77_9PEZI|nr:hypothetical protein QBC34DRAFT_164257 [Podospora aff. communis PSN243]
MSYDFSLLEKGFQSRRMRSTRPRPAPAPAESKSTPKTITYAEMAASKPFRFTIGSEKREFYIPSLLVANQSPVFEGLVNGNFKEAREYHVKLESVDEETFACFVRFVYTGKHSDKPRPDNLTVPRGPQSTDESEYDDPFSVVISTKKQDGGPKRKRQASISSLGNADEDEQQSFQLRTKKKKGLLETFRGTHSSKAVIEPPYILAPSPDTPSALQHVKVFVFADYWGITSLSEVSLQSLGVYLDGLILRKAAPSGPKKLAEVVELVEYCYSEPRPEGLTSLVVLFCASRIESLWSSRDFRHVFSKYNDFRWL